MQPDELEKLVDETQKLLDEARIITLSNNTKRPSIKQIGKVQDALNKVFDNMIAIKSISNQHLIIISNRFKKNFAEDIQNEALYSVLNDEEPSYLEHFLALVMLENRNLGEFLCDSASNNEIELVRKSCLSCKKMIGYCNQTDVQSLRVAHLPFILVQCIFDPAGSMDIEAIKIRIARAICWHSGYLSLDISDAEWFEANKKPQDFSDKFYYILFEGKKYYQKDLYKLSIASVCETKDSLAQLMSTILPKNCDELKHFNDELKLIPFKDVEERFILAHNSIAMYLLKQTEEKALQLLDKSVELKFRMSDAPGDIHRIYTRLCVDFLISFLSRDLASNHGIEEISKCLRSDKNTAYQLDTCGGIAQKRLDNSGMIIRDKFNFFKRAEWVQNFYHNVMYLNSLRNFIIYNKYLSDPNLNLRELLIRLAANCTVPDKLFELDIIKEQKIKSARNL